jgi:hypothetical protein
MNDVIQNLIPTTTFEDIRFTNVCAAGRSKISLITAFYFHPIFYSTVLYRSGPGTLDLEMEDTLHELTDIAVL